MVAPRERWASCSAWATGSVPPRFAQSTWTRFSPSWSSVEIAYRVARLHRAGELVAIRVPTEAEEAVRDLCRARGESRTDDDPHRPGHDDGSSRTSRSLSSATRAPTRSPGVTGNTPHRSRGNSLANGPRHPVGRGVPKPCHPPPRPSKPTAKHPDPECPRRPVPGPPEQTQKPPDDHETQHSHHHDRDLPRPDLIAPAHRPDPEPAPFRPSTVTCGDARAFDTSRSTVPSWLRFAGRQPDGERQGRDLGSSPLGPGTLRQPRAIASTQTVIARMSGTSWSSAIWTP